MKFLNPRVILYASLVVVAGMGVGAWLWLRPTKPPVIEPMVVDQAIKLDRERDYDGAIRLYTKALGMTTDENHIATIHNDRGVSYQHKGDHVSAIADFNEAVRLNKGYGKAYVNRGKSHAALHEMTEAIADFTASLPWGSEESGLFYRGLAYEDEGEYDKAIADFTKLCGRRPPEDKPFVNRGIAWGYKREFDKAVADYTEAIRINPANSNAYNNRGVVYQDRGELGKALADFNAALRIKPGDAMPLAGRGAVYAAQGNAAGALADFDAAIRSDPANSVAYLRRGRVREEGGEYAKALADFNAAVRLSPKYAAACNNLAWLQATCPDAGIRNGKSAVNYALLACRVSQMKYPAYIDTLAAAYAESGDFDKAMATQQQYIDSPGLPPAGIEDGKTRLVLYQQKKPFREERKP